MPEGQREEIAPCQLTTPGVLKSGTNCGLHSQKNGRDSVIDSVVECLLVNMLISSPERRFNI